MLGSNLGAHFVAHGGEVGWAEGRGGEIKYEVCQGYGGRLDCGEGENCEALRDHIRTALGRVAVGGGVVDSPLHIVILGRLVRVELGKLKAGTLSLSSETGADVLCRTIGTMCLAHFQ